MRLLTFPIIPALLSVAAGYCVTRFWPVPETKPPAPVLAASLSDDRPPWMGQKGAARLAACMEYSATLEAAAWPAVFARYQHDELLRSTLIEGWIAADPAGFWQWIVQRKDAGLLAEAGTRLFAAWAQRDAAAAFAATATIASHHLRDPLRTMVVETELARNLQAGLALAAKFGPLHTNAHVNQAWMERDPAAALHGLTALPGGRESFRRFYLSRAAGLLAKRDPEAFVAWLETQPRGVESAVDKHTFTEGAPMKAARAIAALAALKPGQQRDDALRGAIAIGGAQLPPDETIRLARQHLKNWERNSAIAEAAEIAAKSDPPKAAALLAAVPASRYVIYSAPDVTHGLAKQDWNAARAWVRSLPDAPVRRAAWPALSANIPPERLGEFAASIATLPVEELSDSLLLRVRNALKATGPDAVGQWMDSLPPDHAAWVREMKNIQ